LKAFFPPGCMVHGACMEYVVLLICKLDKIWSDMIEYGHLAKGLSLAW
jgi:hypothetical protein